MRTPINLRSRSTLFAVAGASVLLAACAGEATAPKLAQRPSQLRTSPFVPSAVQKALVGVSDGTYSFTIDPSVDQSLSFGASHIDIPANAVCELSSSSYGPEHWNDSCTPETAPLTITAVVKNAATDHPSVDFEPALRFNPETTVSLFLYVTDQATLDASRVVEYCNASGCVDESLTDPSLRSNVDTTNNVVFRRIKHFSGYVVAEFASDLADALGF
jgi:hypothetical protein